MFLSKLSILVYHRVLPVADPMRPGDIDAPTFERHIRSLAKVFRVMSLTDGVAALRRGRIERGAVAITFDDGYADNATVALPILQKLGVTATFFIASDFLDGGRMWNDTVIEAVRAHTDDMLDLTALELDRYATGTEQAKCAAAQMIVNELKYLPQPRRDEQVRAIARAVGAALPDDLMMTGGQIRALAAGGMTIGGHTASHPILSRIDDETALGEIEGNRRVLQRITGQPVDLFAYPNGRPGVDYTPRHVEMVRDLGFAAAVSTTWGTADAGSDPYQLPRFTPWQSNTGKYLLRLLAERWRPSQAA